MLLTAKYERANMENKVYVHIQNPRGVYYPGEIVQGNVECVFIQPQTVEGLFLIIKGRARTTVKGSKTAYHDKEDYFNEEFNLLSNNGEEVEFSANTYSYPFSYILPNRLPSTYEYKNGNVRYSLEATVKRPWKFDFHHKLLFQVISPANYNLEPLASLVPSVPPRVSNFKNIGYFCCTSGIIEATAVCSSKVLVCNTPATFFIKIINMSRMHCNMVELKIYASFVFSAHSYKKIKNHTLVSWQEGGVPAQSERSWFTSKLLQGDFVNLIDCKIIKCNYFLEINCVLPLPFRNLKLQLPLIISEVPLQNASNQVIH